MIRRDHGHGKRRVETGLLLILASAPTATLVRSVRRRAVRWRDAADRRLRAGSRVVHTAHGPVEYGEAPQAGDDRSGPPLLVLHGTAGGYASGLVLGRAAAASVGDASAGCRLVASSRPGYLRTPLSAGRTFADQAAVIAALLDALGIERAVVAGVSSGAPPAIELALGALALTGRLRLRRAGIADPRALTTLRDLGAACFPLDLSTAGMRNDDAQVAAMSDLPLETLTVPTLIVHGTADRTVPFSPRPSPRRTASRRHGCCQWRVPITRGRSSPPTRSARSRRSSPVNEHAARAP